MSGWQICNSQRCEAVQIIVLSCLQSPRIKALILRLLKDEMFLQPRLKSDLLDGTLSFMIFRLERQYHLVI